MFQTRLTSLLKIQHPIIEGGLQWLGTAELAAAVSEAGALGTICARTLPSPEALRQEIRKARAITTKPVGVNLTISRLHSVDLDGFVDVILEEGVPAVETSGDNPARYIGRLKDRGVVVIHKITSVRHARKAEEVGADAVSVVGYESGGRIGLDEVGLLALIPRVVDAVRVPVAGTGAADGRGLLAILALGADGLVMGTRFVATEECIAHPTVKQRLVEATELGTLLTERGIGNTSRVLRTPFAERLLEMERKGATLEEMLPYIAGERVRRALTEGALDQGTISVGQAVGLIDRIMPAGEVVSTVMAQAAAEWERLATMRG